MVFQEFFRFVSFNSSWHKLTNINKRLFGSFKNRKLIPRLIKKRAEQNRNGREGKIERMERKVEVHYI
jgi:hypothetical protein